MGIDVNLIALGEVSDEELESALEFMNNRLFEQKWFGPWVKRADHGEYLYGSPAINISCNRERIYRRHYRRGNWPYIANILMTAKAALPDSCKIYYGSDDDLTALGHEVTDEVLAEHWALWFTGQDPKGDL